MGLLDVGLKKEDRKRFDSLLFFLGQFKTILHDLRNNDEIVVRISLSRKNQHKDDIQK